jgi:hypothetical protein
LKLIQERAGNTLKAIGIVKDFLCRTQVAQQLGERIDKWDYMKLKILHNKRNGLLSSREHPQNGRKYLLAIQQTKD